MAEVPPKLISRQVVGHSCHSPPVNPMSDSPLKAVVRNEQFGPFPRHPLLSYYSVGGGLQFDWQALSHFNLNRNRRRNLRRHSIVDIHIYVRRFQADYQRVTRLFLPAEKMLPLSPPSEGRIDGDVSSFR